VSDPAANWWKRWKNARRAHYSNADKLWQELRESHPKVARSTVLAWEGVPAKRASYPGPAYRPTLSGLNPDFDKLIGEVEERERASDGLSLPGLAAALSRLEETVELLQATVEENAQRLDRLEQQSARTAARRGRATRAR
jgi:hypothetical protein